MSIFLKIINIVALLVIGIFIGLDWVSLVSKLKGIKNITLTFLAGLLGPIGMFYWGFWIGLASLLGILIFTLPWSFLDIPINGWFHLIRTLTFVWMSLKINSLTSEERESLKKLDFKSFFYLIWQMITGFLLYGFVVYLLWKVIT